MALNNRFLVFVLIQISPRCYVFSAPSQLKIKDEQYHLQPYVELLPVPGKRHHSGQHAKFRPVSFVNLADDFPMPGSKTPAPSMSTAKSELECEFPPKMEEDLSHVRRKRLTTESGLVCLEDYPYTVSIRLHGKHWCGGAIVGKQWILSAAQCFDYVTKQEVSIRVGSVFRDFGGQILSVIEIKLHPSYKMDQYYPEHNLAMVKVNLPIIPGPRTQPVTLAAAESDLPPLFGETVVTGYGSVVTGQIREGVNQELRRMIVREVPRSECRLLYGNDYRLQHDHICLQSVVKGVALCAGDTGDPAVHFSGMNRAGTLFGIALFSGTEECALKSKPGVFAKVSYSRSWIDKILDEIPKLTESADSGENTIPLDLNDFSK